MRVPTNMRCVLDEAAGDRRLVCVKVQIRTPPNFHENEPIKANLRQELA